MGADIMKKQIYLIIGILFFGIAGFAQAYQIDPSTDPVFSSKTGNYGNLLLMFVDERDTVLFGMILADLWLGDMLADDNSPFGIAIDPEDGADFEILAEVKEPLNVRQMEALTQLILDPQSYDGIEEILALSDTAEIPEPSTFILFGAGLILISRRIIRCKKSRH